jgi:FixJ family two-component response regulator
MKEMVKWAFILDKDEFVRLSLNKILKRYGFQVEEIEDFSQLERRKKDVGRGMILADVEIDVLEKELALLRRWNNRFILMTPLITDELSFQLKKMGIHHVIKKPVDPRLLRKVIREISFPGGVKIPSLGKKRESSNFIQKGGEVI